MTDQATAAVQPQETLEAIGLENNWPLDLLTKFSKPERFGLYDSIAKKEHTITIGGVENQGVFAPILQQFPDLSVEVEESWYKTKRTELGLCVSIYHGIINTKMTSFNTLGQVFGPGQSEHWIKELFDRWHRNLRNAVSGDDPVLARTFRRPQSGGQPVQMRTGISLSQFRPSGQAGAPAQEKLMPSIEKDDRLPGSSIAGTVGSNASVQRQLPFKLSGDAIDRHPDQLSRVQAPIINNSNQPNDQTRYRASLPASIDLTKGSTRMDKPTSSNLHINAVVELKKMDSLPLSNGIEVQAQNAMKPSANHSFPLNSQARPNAAVPASIAQNRAKISMLNGLTPPSRQPNQMNGQSRQMAMSTANGMDTAPMQNEMRPGNGSNQPNGQPRQTPSINSQGAAQIQTQMHPPAKVRQNPVIINLLEDDSTPFGTSVGKVQMPAGMIPDHCIQKNNRERQASIPSGSHPNGSQMPNIVASNHGSNQMSNQARQASMLSETPNAATQVQNSTMPSNNFHHMATHTPQGASAPSGTVTMGAVLINGSMFSSSNRHLKNMNGQAQHSPQPYPEPNGFQVPTGNLPSLLDGQIKHQDVIHNSNLARTAPLQIPTPPTLKNDSSQFNGQFFNIQANGIPQNPSQGHGRQAFSMNLSGMQAAGMSMQFGQPMAQQDSGFASGRSSVTPSNVFRTPVTPATPTRNAATTPRPSKGEDQLKMQLEAEYNLLIQQYSLNETSQDILRRHYKGLYQARSALDHATANEMLARINKFLQHQKSAPGSTQQSGSLSQIQNSVEKKLQTAPEGIPSMPTPSGSGLKQGQNETKSEVQPAPNNGTPTQPPQKDYSQPIPRGEWEAHFQRLKADCERRIQLNSLAEPEQNVFRKLYQAFFNARKAGDEAQAKLAYHSITIFPDRKRRGSKSFKEAPASFPAVATAGSGQMTLPAFVSTSFDQINSHSTSGQSMMNVQSMNAQSMHGQSMGGQSMNDQIMNGQPMNLPQQMNCQLGKYPGFNGWRY